MIEDVSADADKLVFERARARLQRLWQIFFFVVNRHYEADQRSPGQTLILFALALTDFPVLILSASKPRGSEVH